MVAAPLLDSSSGWACTAISRSCLRPLVLPDVSCSVGRVASPGRSKPPVRSGSSGCTTLLPTPPTRRGPPPCRDATSRTAPPRRSSRPAGTGAVATRARRRRRLTWSSGAAGGGGRAARSRSSSTGSTARRRTRCTIVDGDGRHRHSVTVTFDVRKPAGKAARLHACGPAAERRQVGRRRGRRCRRRRRPARAVTPRTPATTSRPVTGEVPGAVDRRGRRRTRAGDRSLATSMCRRGPPTGTLEIPTAVRLSARPAASRSPTDPPKEIHVSTTDRDAPHLAVPGRVRPAPGRARRAHREPPGDRRRDQRPPRGGRPARERRLPRRPRGAGQDGGPHPLPPGAAAHRPGRRGAQRGRGRAGHGRHDLLRRRRRTTPRRSCSARGRSPPPPSSPSTAPSRRWARRSWARAPATPSPTPRPAAPTSRSPSCRFEPFAG